jgi:hypothetical protein
MPIRKIHVVWVGDEAKRPDTMIQTWRNLNPEWDVRVWGNREYYEKAWVNKRHMDALWSGPRAFSSVAEMMRWEVLHEYGGLAVSARSACIRPLQDWLFDAPMVASSDDESVARGLLAPSPVYSEPEHPLVAQLIKDIGEGPPDCSPSVMRTRLNDAYNRDPAAYTLKILPSITFVPMEDRDAGVHVAGQTFAMPHRAPPGADPDASHNSLPSAVARINGYEHNIYFVHRLLVNEQRHLDRLGFLAPRVQGAKVLHIGFVDFPVTNPADNLHVGLAKVCKELVGYDLNRHGAELLRAHLPTHQRRVHFDLSELANESFDWVLVPEVLEHADNMSDTLAEISNINARQFAFTVPDAFALPHFYMKRNEMEAFEVVHPDHNCWFSPYTLCNVIRKFTTLRVRELYRINMSVVALCGRDE